MKIVLHIDRLVLDGLPVEPAHAARIHRAAERELTRLLGREPAPQQLLAGGAASRIDAPHIAPGPGEGPGALGARIARAVHGALEGRA